jgi:glycyl-tRNA synthetase
MEEKNEIVINSDGTEFKLNNEFIKFTREEKTILEEKYVPSVIEPSFGIGRIIYCVLEHAFRMRENDAARTYFHFKALVAPIKCSLLPLMTKPELVKKSYELKTLLTSAGMSSKLDDSGQTVGKRYARTDECGIPYAFTIDFDTLENNTVTMREIDTMKQIRLPMAEAPKLLSDLVNNFTTWADCMTKYNVVEAEVKAEEKE